MTTYMIDSGDGNWIANGGQNLTRARKLAQRLADERNDTVTVYESPMPTDEDGEGCGYSEDIDPVDGSTDPQAPILSADLPGGDGARVHILGAKRASH